MRADGVLTSVDVDPEHQRLARKAFTEASFAANRYRLIGGKAEVTGALNDFSSLRQALRLEGAQRGFDIVAVERLCQRRRIVSGLGDAGSDVGPRHEGGVA